MAIKSINPATDQEIHTYEEMSEGEVGRIIEGTRDAAQAWSHTSFSTRAQYMTRAGEILRERTERYAKLMTDEMGKPIAASRAEVEKCAWVCDYYAENAEAFLSPEDVETDARSSYIAFRPIGVVLAVMPWNFPFWQVFRFAAPALMAGNGGVLKHASNVFGSALAIEEVFRDAGFPERLFRTLLIGSSGVNAVIDHPDIAAATLTGSTPAGRAVAARAGHQLKKTVLELGGSDPYLVLEDADLEATVASCVESRLINAGQSCISAKRFIVHESVFDEFEERYVALMKDKRMGDPNDEDNHLGPLARKDLRDELHGQVIVSIDNGARCLIGGEIPRGVGAYYPPTVLSDVEPGMPAYDDELFGPVAALIRAKDEDDAVRIANDSPFGLGAAVFTQDLDRGERIARDALQAGACFVNAFVKSDPRLPFGGIKESGYGRELSHFGIREFVNIKTVFIA